MTVIEADGVETKPYTVDSLEIFACQWGHSLRLFNNISEVYIFSTTLFSSSTCYVDQEDAPTDQINRSLLINQSETTVSSQVRSLLIL